MTITATPTVFELHEETEFVARIEMFDEGASQVTIKTLVDGSSWKELSEAIQGALDQMHPRETAVKESLTVDPQTDWAAA